MKLFWKRAEFPMAHLVECGEFLEERRRVWGRLRAGGEAAPLGFAWRDGALWFLQEWRSGAAAYDTAVSFDDLLAASVRLARWESEGIFHGDLHAGNLLVGAGGAEWIDWDWAWDTGRGPSPWRMSRSGELSSASEARDLWRVWRELQPRAFSSGFTPRTIQELIAFVQERRIVGTAPGTARGFLSARGLLPSGAALPHAERPGEAPRLAGRSGVRGRPRR